MAANSHRTHTNVFYGVEDTDSDPLYVKPNDNLGSFALRVGYGIQKGAMENWKGNTLTNYVTLPSGTNKTIGTYEDYLGNSIIYFVYNSLGNHRIYRYFPNEARTSTIASGAALNFQPNYYIHSVQLVDNRYLFYTDGWEDTDQLGGNPPRKIDIVKSDNYQKKYQYEFHFALDNQFNYTTLNGTSIIVNATTVNFIGITNRKSAINLIKQTLSAAGFETQYIEDTLTINTVALNTVITTTSTTWNRLVPYNFYNTGDIDASQINWARPQPLYAPTIEFQNNINAGTKRVPAQYCVRYIFDDGQKSAWGEYSRMTYNDIPTGFQTLIDFYDPNLNDINYLTFIKKVEIGVRYGNTQSVESVKILNTSNIGFVIGVKSILIPTINSNHFITITTAKGTQVGSDDSTIGEVQVLKPYDNVPQLLHTFSMVSDENGVTFAALSNMMEGYANITTDVTVSITEISTASGAINKRVTLKPRGIYDLFGVYYDEFGRSGGSNFFVNEMLTTDKLMQTSIRVNINHTPPSWAKTYQIFRSKEKQIASYRVYSGVVRTIGSSEVVWKMPVTHANTPSDTTNIVVYFDEKFKSDFSLAAKGDRLRGWDEDGIVNFDVEIIGYKIDANGDTHLITHFGIGLFSFIEVYSPQQNTDSFAYATSIKLPIVNGFHYGDVQTQTALAPAIVQFVGGDTKWDSGADTERYSQVYYPSESNSRVINEDIGRVSVYDPNAQRRWNKQGIRISGTYHPSTSINELSAFKSLDYISLNYQYGSIQRLVELKGNLIAVCRHKLQPIYVNRDRMVDFQDNSTVGRTSRILNIAEPTMSYMGTRNPESILKVEGEIYGWDSYNGIFWRFGQEGQQDMSYNKANEFAQIGRERMTAPRLTDKVILGYEKKYKSLYVSFSNTPARLPFVKIFQSNEEIKGWCGDAPLTDAEMFGCVNDVFVSFAIGRMWMHDTNLTRCMLYGTQFTPTIKVAVNAEPTAVKTPLAFNAQITNDIIIPLMEVKARKNYPLGQKSKIAQVEKWKVQEGQYHAVVLRDYTDNAKRFTDIVDTNIRETTALLQGRDLKFEVMEVTLQLVNPSELTRLFLLETEYFVSENTKTE